MLYLTLFVVLFLGAARASWTGSCYRHGCRWPFFSLYTGHSVESSVLLQHRAGTWHVSTQYFLVSFFLAGVCVTFIKLPISYWPYFRWIVEYLICVRCLKKWTTRGSQRVGTCCVLGCSRHAAPTWVWTPLRCHKPREARSHSMVS